MLTASILARTITSSQTKMHDPPIFLPVFCLWRCNRQCDLLFNRQPIWIHGLNSCQGSNGSLKDPGFDDRHGQRLRLVFFGSEKSQSHDSRRSSHTTSHNKPAPELPMSSSTGISLPLILEQNTIRGTDQYEQNKGVFMSPPYFTAS